MIAIRQQLWQYHKSCNCHTTINIIIYLTSESVALPVTVTGRSDFAAPVVKWLKLCRYDTKRWPINLPTGSIEMSVDGLCVSQKFLSLLYQTQKLTPIPLKPA